MCVKFQFIDVMQDLEERPAYCWSLHRKGNIVVCAVLETGVKIVKCWTVDGDDLKFLKSIPMDEHIRSLHIRDNLLFVGLHFTYFQSSDCFRFCGGRDRNMASFLRRSYSTISCT